MHFMTLTCRTQLKCTVLSRKRSTNYNFDVPSLVCIHDYLLELMFSLDTVNTVPSIIAKISFQKILKLNVPYCLERTPTQIAL